MATAETIPIVVEPEAAERVESLGMRREFREMLAQCRALFPDLRAVEVELSRDRSLSDDPAVVIHVYRPAPGPGPEPASRHWEQWSLASFPIEVVRNFSLLVWDGEPDGRQTVHEGAAASEYLLVSPDGARARGRREVRDNILEALESGPATPMTRKDSEVIRRQVRARHESDRDHNEVRSHLSA